MLTAEKLNRCSLGRPNRIPIVIDDDVRPLVCILKSELGRVGSHGVIDESSLSSSLLVPPLGRHV
jgi:hypothetical protein